MLNRLRQSASSWVAKALFGVLVASFAIWGIGDIFRGPGRDTVVAKVGERAITGSELMIEFQREIQRLRPLFDEGFDAERARDLGVLDTVVQRMLDRAVFDEAASDLGIAVSDTIVRREIVGNPNFQSAAGLFDKFTYEQAIRSAGFTPQSYEEALRQEVARFQLANTVQSGAKAPESLVKALYAVRNERRVAEVVTIPAASFTDIGEPSETELEAFHREQADRFTAPEYRKVTAIVLEAEDLAREIAVPEEDLREAYESSPGRFMKPGRRNIRQILLDDEEAARRASKMLSEGMEFTQVAEEVAGLEEADTTIGWITKEALLPELVDPVFALQEGAVTEPIKTAIGWHIIQVTGVQREEVRSFEDAREELREEIANELALEGLYSLATRLEDELAGGATLEDAAARLNLKLITVEAIDSRGLGPDGKAVEGLPAKTFVETAFATNEGEESLLTETPEGGYFILRVDKVTPSAVRPLASVRDEVIAAWKEDRRLKAAEARAKAIVERVRGGEALADVAAEMGLEVETTQPMLRNDPKFHPYLLLKLFDERVGGVAMAAFGDSYLVAQLKSIQAADPEADKEGVKALAQQLDRAFANDLLAQYGAALHDRYTVKVNTRAIDALF